MRLNFHGVLALLAGSSATLVEESSAQDINFIHWNPHWQCFVGHPTCSLNVSLALDRLLTPEIDFANLVEMEAKHFSPPAGWAAVAPFDSCGHDWDTLWYNSAKWRRLSERSGCIVPGRSFAAGVFQREV